MTNTLKDIELLHGDCIELMKDIPVRPEDVAYNAGVTDAIAAYERTRKESGDD